LTEASRKNVTFLPLRSWIILVTILPFVVYCSSYYQITIAEFNAVKQHYESGMEFEYLDMSIRTNLSSTPGNMIDPQRSKDPQIATMGSNIYVLWQEEGHKLLTAEDELTRNSDILFRKSSDGGDSFGKTIFLSNNTNSSISAHPRIAVQDNDVYAVWLQDGKDILFRKSSDGGDSFGKITKIGEDDSFSSFEDDLNLAASNDDVSVLWSKKWSKNSDILSTKDILFRKSSDGGDSFGKTITMAQRVNLDDLDLYVQENDVHILWHGRQFSYSDHSPVHPVHSYWRYSTDAGNSFGNTIVINNSIVSKPAFSDMNVYIVGTELEKLIPGFVNGEDVYFMKVDSNRTKTQPPLSSHAVDRLQFFDTAGSEIVIDGKIDDRGYRSIDGYPRSPWTFNISNYTINLGSTNDTKNMYIYATVERISPYNYTGNITLLMLFNEDQSGILRQGDDAIMLNNNLSKGNLAGYPFEDMFWDIRSNSIQRDIDYGGTNDGSAAISFSNGIEYFELSRPLCSDDVRHDFCVSPAATLGFSLILENKSELISISQTPEFNYFSALGGIDDKNMCNVFRGCAPSLPTLLIPPAGFILEVLNRVNATERENFLKVLTYQEMDELERYPGPDNLENFLNKLIPSELYKLLNSFTPSELTDTSYIMTNQKFQNLLDKLSQAERNTVLNKLQTIN
jgi:hypothetical protein